MGAETGCQGKTICTFCRFQNGECTCSVDDVCFVCSDCSGYEFRAGKVTLLMFF
jgi:hypothetical protein